MGRWLTPFLSVLLSWGCSPAAPDPAPNAGPAPGGKLTFALVPAEDAETMVESFDPVRKHIERETGVPVEVTAVTDYGSVVEAMRQGKVDVAWYGPLSYVLARQETGAEAFAVGKTRGADATYRAYIVVRADNPAKTLADLAGKRMALVDPGSTSGNLVPRGMVMGAVGKSMEDHFGKVVYAGGHDASLMALIAGSVDACAVQEITFRKFTEERPNDMRRVRVLLVSDPMPQSPFAFRRGLDSGLKARVRAALLNAHERGVSLDVRGQGDYERFVPAAPEDFDGIARLARTMGLTREAMAK